MNNFNPLIPHNTLQSLPPEVDFHDTDLLVLAMETIRSVSQLRTRLTLNKRSIANTLDLLSPLFVPEAVASSSIENIITTNDSVYIAKIKAERELTPAEKEALNYTEALMQGARIVNKKGFLATNDYIFLQEILEPKKKGLRNYTGTTLTNPHTKKVYYTPPTGKALIRDMLSNYEKYYNDKAPIEEIYARMAILHYQFEAIHPFGDGNGRTGRILMPLYLTLQGELPVPVLFISQYILEHRDEYYKKLREVTEKGAWKNWILFIMSATKEQAEYTCKILEQIQKNISTVKQLLKDNFKNMYSSELVDFLFSMAYFTEKQFMEELKISRATAHKYLILLTEKKIIEKKKQSGRNRYLYVNPKYINILLGV
ncbi:MAG: Fic family protein [Candidatus Nomurabacteria bacterium]|jgi:Fic family protein|nr:Fic family protein [Candidatus Nomurabacteria bacterium]